MNRIPTTRAAHVVELCNVLRAIGTPVERELAKAKLPGLIEEVPDALISNLRSLEFTANCAMIEGIEDIGWLAAKHYSTSQLSQEVVSEVSSAFTVKQRLEKLFLLSKLEDSHFDVRFGAINEFAQVIGNVLLPQNLSGMAASEWLQIMVLVETVRSVTGAHWCPEKITFQNNFTLAQEAQEHFANTVFEMGAANTSISFPTEVLAASTNQISPKSFDNAQPALTDLEGMGALLGPYLREQSFTVSDAGELFGLSSRQFQRHLQDLGTNYCRLVDNIRFDMARDLMQDPSNKILDVALSVGFEDQSNFGRSFRRVSGMSPSKYRRAVLLSE